MGTPESSEKKAAKPKTKVATPLAPAPKAKKVAAKAEKTPKSAPALKSAAKVALKAAPAAKKPAPAPLAAPAAPAFDDIALRAYFIGEKRQQLGLPGDSDQDWVEAERQLIEEAKAKKPVRSKSAN